MTNLTAEQLFERTVLNQLLTNTEYFSKVFGILRSEYFTENRQEIFKLLQVHYKEHKIAPGLADVGIKIKNLQNQEHKNAVVEELRQLKDADVPKSQEALQDETLKFVKDALYLKALEVGSEGLMLKSDDLKLKAEQILDERSKVNIESDLGIELHDAAQIIDYYGTTTKGITTHLKSLNDRLGSGFLPGTLSLIAAPSGVGKSLMMTDFVTGMVKAGKKVLLVSLEMSSQEILKRVHSNILNIPIEEFEPKKFDRDKFIKAINESRAKNRGLFFAKDYPALSFSSLQLESLLETFKNEKDIEFDIVMVDYLGIMKSDLLNPSAGLYSYVKSIAEELRSVAKRKKIATISASQLNRQATNNLDADNAAISDSYGTLMTADFLMFLLQTEDMKATGDIVCKITKNRFSGKTESFPLKVDYAYMRFIDPEIPTTIQAKSDFLDTFNSNVQKTDQQFDEFMQQDKDLAPIIDAKMRKSESNKSNTLNDILEGLL